MSTKCLSANVFRPKVVEPNEPGDKINKLEADRKKKFETPFGFHSLKRRDNGGGVVDIAPQLGLNCRKFVKFSSPEWIKVVGKACLQNVLKTP